jgi:Uma2 family endonuclease
MTVAAVRRFTVEDYHRLIELGFLTEGDRLELIRGELIEMATKGTPHTVCGGLLCRQLDRLVGESAAIRGQDPITLLIDSEPEPDVVIARGQLETYVHHHPYAEDIILIIEVSDTTLNFDQTTKLKLYAEAGISDYWIANLNAQQLERHSQPYQTAQGEFQYRSRLISLPNESVLVPNFENVALKLSQIFPERTA